MTVGQRIKQLREERGWRQTYLAVEVDLSFEMIYAYERDKSTPRLKTLAKFCDAFGITPEEFMKGVEIR